MQAIKHKEEEFLFVFIPIIEVLPASILYYADKNELASRSSHSQPRAAQNRFVCLVR